MHQDGTVFEEKTLLDPEKPKVDWGEAARLKQAELDRSEGVVHAGAKARTKSPRAASRRKKKRKLRRQGRRASRR